MMKNGIYLQLQLKRAWKLFPVIFLITMITVSSIALTAAVLLRRDAESENKQKISIGIVGNIDDTYLGVGVYALKNIDSSRFFVDFREMEEEAAIEALKSREIAGYVYIPENFIEDVLYGVNTPATYVTLNGPDSFGSVLTKEITQIVSDLVTESQAGIYSMQRFARDYDKTEQLDEKNRQLNMAYIETVLGRTGSYELTIAGVSDTLSMGGYYICGILMFFLLIWGISCNKLLGNKSITLSRSLRASGMKTSWELLCEYAGFFTVTLGTLLLLALAVGLVVQTKDFGIRELQGADAFSCIGFILKSIPVILMTTAMQMLFYELFSGTVGAVMVQFLIAIGLGYLSGCFYPNYFFPDGVQRFAAWLPSGVGFSYLRKTMAELSVLLDLGMLALYTAVFAALTVWVRKHRIAGDGQ